MQKSLVFTCGKTGGIEPGPRRCEETERTAAWLPVVSLLLVRFVWHILPTFISTSLLSELTESVSPLVDFSLYLSENLQWTWLFQGGPEETLPVAVRHLFLARFRGEVSFPGVKSLLHVALNCAVEPGVEPKSELLLCNITSFLFLLSSESFCPSSPFPTSFTLHCLPPVLPTPPECLSLRVSMTRRISSATGWHLDLYSSLYVCRPAGKCGLVYPDHCASTYSSLFLTALQPHALKQKWQQN